MIACLSLRVWNRSDCLSRLPEVRRADGAHHGVVVFDLEYTAWEGSQARGWSGTGEHREVVQIGAVKLDSDRGLAETAGLSRLVRPRINPQLSPYLIALTGITQQQLDALGVSFGEALTELIALGPAAVFCSNGPDGEVLAENCWLAQLPPLREPERFVDIRPFLSCALQRPSDDIESCRLAAEFCAGTAGRAHDALADARGVAAALRHSLGRLGLGDCGLPFWLNRS